jgi:hypothetical protein
MATTGTYAFNPAASNLLLTAFGRIGIRSPEITDQHLADAEVEGNLLQVEIGNKQPNAWSAELYTQVLTAGTATYTLPTRLIAIRDAYLTTAFSSGDSNDTVLWPLSTQDYDSQSSKSIQGVPTSYWMNRLITPTITMWPVPNDSATYTLNLRIMTQVHDATIRNGYTLDMPYRFLDVWVAGMAHRMSRIYAPNVEALRKADYQEAWANAAAQDLDDNVTMSIGPDFSGYFKR